MREDSDQSAVDIYCSTHSLIAPGCHRLMAVEMHKYYFCLIPTLPTAKSSSCISRTYWVKSDYVE